MQRSLLGSASDVFAAKAINALKKSDQRKLIKSIVMLTQESSLENRLTATEGQVCVGLFLGLSAKSIAKIRGCSSRTVENHIANVKRKNNGEPLTPLVLATVFLQIETMTPS